MTDLEIIRVLLVDDHALVRFGIRHYLYSFDWIETVGEAGNGAEAVEFCATHDVDVVLMDMVMPVMDGSEATRRIIALDKPPKVIVLTSFHEQNLVEDALRAGATSYLLKNVRSEELAAAIRSAYVGRSTLAPEAAEALIAATRRQPGIGADLTDRELETLTSGCPRAFQWRNSGPSDHFCPHRDLSPHEHIHEVGRQESRRGGDHRLGTPTRRPAPLIFPLHPSQKAGTCPILQVAGRVISQEKN